MKKTIRLNKKGIFAVITAGFMLTAGSLKYWVLPFFWISLIWCSIFFTLFLQEKKSYLAATFLNLSFLILCLGGAEYYYGNLSTSPKETLEGNYWTPDMFKQDPILGYVPQKNAHHVVGKRYLNDQLVYDMAFSTNEHGLRQTYPKSSNTNSAILFFGCSFTFGVGLNDNQTLPYQVGALLNGSSQVYNFAYGGYGSQQMLSALEHGLVDKIVAENPKHAFYVAILHHINRSAGLTTWNIHDPKYELNENGQIYLAGHFDDHLDQQPFWIQRIKGQLNKSFLWNKIQASQVRQINDHDIKRYIEIVLQSKAIFESRYPDAQFHVIFWDLYQEENTHQMTTKIIKTLQENNVPVHMVSHILPQLHTQQEQYFIVNDGHPNAKANYTLAQYLSNHVLK